jgi:hypothetical protein
MSDPAVDRPHAHSALPRSWVVFAVVAAVMVLLALVGVGLTTADSSRAHTFWYALVPVYGLLCMAAAWADGNRLQVLRQFWHWLGIAAALALDFFIRGTGEESGISAGLNALLLLAVGCYLAGVHLNWRFVPVGVLLCVTLVLAARAEQYLWVMFVLGAVALVGLIGARFVFARKPKVTG